MYLTSEQLANCQQKMLQAPYVCNNGTVLNDMQVAAYNRYTQDINETKCVKTRNYLMDNRHKYFCFVSGMQGV